MTKTIRVKPADGRIVRDPLRGDDLPADGREVPRNVYWRRCVRAGDVIEMAVPDAIETAITTPSGGAQGKATKGSKG
ncbi:DUF2635 domain-containing protein [Burkholderia arboris]|uniref:DUF2635 domain-containing protein n=1 Tax=Burkholderia cepacia complex TaxID=87882 RepID=UPI00064AF4D0|nr:MULTISPECIES: DUF2635 domain-containing protein [Burkholderia cepacia complex]AKM43970.1 hypothetical protein NL30_29945 [Burkholderia contaminans]MCA8034891.1 DUF2635 domain-containing protein [Burkholderia arboris]